MSRELTIGSLFAGIGGFDLGLERAGMRSVWQCEIDPYAVRVLEKHWPDVLRVRDVRDVRAGTVAAVDVICGGFPCQDISKAGAGRGLAGARSGLWSEMLRVVCDLRPRYLVVENVSALLGRGLDRVLGDLAACGFDAEWDCLPASALGAPHSRDRIWIVAYPNGTGLEGHGRPLERARALAASPRVVQPVRWADEPSLPRVVDGVPNWMDRVRVTGNALVPQIAEWLGRRIIDYEEGWLSDVA